MTTTTEPRIYVASLSDYNAGILHGKWIDATQDADDILAEVQEMLKASPTARREGSVAEEWAIHDYEGFGSWKMSEWEQFTTVAEVAAAIEQHGEGPVAAFLDLGISDGWDESAFDEAYRGEAESAKAWAEDFVYETIGSPEEKDWLDKWNSYIDWDHYAHEMTHDGITFVETGAPSYGVYVFWPS